MYSLQTHRNKTALSFKQTLKGMSLVEFITVIAIVGVLTTVAAPFLGDLIARYQAEAAGNHVLSTLKYCRVEALKRENNVICEINASTENKNVTSRIYADTNNSGSYEANADQLLNSSVMSNTSFLKVSPAESTWTYNRTGTADNTALQQIVFCSVIEDKSLHLETIYIDPRGVIYMKEAENNANCPA